MSRNQEREQVSPRRRAVLDAVRDASTPLGVTEVADQLAVHPNTVRFHLDALVAQGHVERTVEEPSGPGRPRAVYTARRGMDRGGARRYRLLARMLLSQLASTGSGAEATATEAGRAWGRYLVEQMPPSRQPTAQEALDRLAAMLADLGFDPQLAVDGGLTTTIRLRHCPFLELAEEYTIVCPMHLGLMQGALAELRAPVEATRLEPFAEPDICLAHLAASRAE
ncbi:helix-turn-helix transcriptional regulator [Streptomyces mirabilis]|uniref:helix-turn-helix transcriptional regulator n=1 Tax=Streptomyces mirabilis TaxID=68239 RepID=UPI003251EDA0